GTRVACGPQGLGTGAERGTGPRGEGPRSSPREGRLDRSGFVCSHGTQETAGATEGRPSSGGGRQPPPHSASRRCKDRGAAAARRRALHGTEREAPGDDRSIGPRKGGEEKAAR